MPFRIAFVSQFRNILLKYIPGKIWVIVGRANTVAQMGYPLKYCSYLSSLIQLIIIISGIFVGIFGIYLFNISFIPKYFSVIVVLFLLFLIIIFSHGFAIPEFHGISFFKFLGPLMGQKMPPMLHVMILSSLHWILMGFAYYLFIKSIYHEINYLPILLQPLANNIGIISPLSPSGLGVREGVMIGYLTLGGVSLAGATSLSLSARVWFFLVEILFFVVGWGLQKKREPDRGEKRSSKA